MSRTVKYTTQMIPHTSKYFLNGTETDKIYDLICVQEGPIKVYAGCSFAEILVIDKIKDKYIFMVDSLTAGNREKIDDLSDSLIETFTEDGTWLYDLTNDTVIYDYRKKEVEGDWRFFNKEKDWTTLLCMDSMCSTPIKLFNSQAKHTLFWGIYYINRYLSNPFNMSVEEFGVERMINLVAEVFNLEKFHNWTHSKEDIVSAIDTFAEDNTDIDKKLFANFEKIYRKQNKKNEESEKKEGTEDGQILLSNKVVHLSDLLNKSIPYSEFLPIEVDIVTDPRINSVHIEDGIVYFASAVKLENRTKRRLKGLFKKSNRKFVEVKTVAELNRQLELTDKFEWYKEIHQGGHGNGTF